MLRGELAPQTPLMDSVGQSELLDMVAITTNLMLPWPVALDTTPSFEADDLPVMVYHCRLLHEEARTLKASPNTHYLTRNSRAFI